jgi:hypothetical protein
VPLTQDIVTNTITKRMDALRNDLKTANSDGYNDVRADTVFAIGSLTKR